MDERHPLFMGPSGWKPFSAKRVPRWTIPNATVYRTIMIMAIIFTLLWQHGFLTTRVAIVDPEDGDIPPPRTGPSYIMDYAPLVWLDIGEQYFPSAIAAQIKNTHPAIDSTETVNLKEPLGMGNLDSLNSFGKKGRNVYLTSNVDVTTRPKWLMGSIPDRKRKAGNTKSCVIIVNDRGMGRVDVFYMYFYAWNLGTTVLFQELGNHLGDWEHNMIRFQDGKPEGIWYSQHNNGEAFTYEAVKKKGIRPIAYSARGSHANYATVGSHDHTIPNLNLPNGLIQDYTSEGTLWDPTKNAYIYNFNGSSSTFTSASKDGESPAGWIYFTGKWGDHQFPDDDKRQRDFLGFRKFVGGPTGPIDKQLNRTLICPDNGLFCIVRHALGP